MFHRAYPLLVLISVCIAPLLNGQTITGSISGIVLDNSGAAISAARIAILNSETGASYRTASADNGEFVLASVLPGAYTLEVEHPGFKKLVKSDLNLTVGDRLSAGRLVLEIGSVTESVFISGPGTAVDTESSDRSQILTADQMSLQIRGRNYLDLLNILPGAVGDERWFNLESAQSSITPNFSGLTSSSNGVFVDGASASSLVNPNWSTTNVSMDSVGEVKVLINNYRAEDGRNGGAIIKSVTKSGTRQLHGSIYDYERNEFFNANYFFNNANGIARPRYRYHTFGGSIGGPVTLGKLFNPGREKVFFFAAVESSPTTIPNSLVQVTMPTALERAGDFSQTLDQNGKLVPIWDPQNNRTPFPNNVVPKTRIDPIGQALLNLFPNANFLNRGISHGNYNYNFQESRDHTTFSATFKIDYNPTSKLRTFFRGNLWRQDDNSFSGAGQSWDMIRVHYQERFRTGAANLTYIINPSTIYEVTVGARGTPNWYSPDQPLTRVQKSSLGVNLPQFYPQNNPNDIIPNLTFGGVPAAAAFGGSNLLNLGYKWTEPMVSATQGLTKVLGTHTLKVGTYTERNRYTNATSGTFGGAINFARDTNNPLDTNWAYSNALLGTYQSYSETDRRVTLDLRGFLMEWYAQDTWKVTRRLTIDYGMRFTYAIPYHQANGNALNFDPARYDPKQQVTLYQPYLNGSTRVARDPLTGTLYPAAYIGAIVPGSGNILNGLVSQSDPSAAEGFIRNRGVQYGPRFGFAYDLTGDGKTAIRGGFGMSYTPFAGQFVLNVESGTVSNTQSTFTTYYGTLGSLQNISGINFPRALSYLPVDEKTPTIESYSLGIQRAVGFGTVVDVSYVGTQGHYLPIRDTNFNTLPFGTRFLPSSIEPTTKSVYPDDFLRPHLGFSGITTLGFPNSNYNSLQSQVQRRFAQGLSFGASWTWSKAMGYVEPYAQYYNERLNYGKLNFDRTHVVNLNYIWDLPRATRLWNNRAIKWAFDAWQTSGIWTFASGRPWTVTYSMTSGPDITGGGDYNRIMVLADPNLPMSDRSISRFFNTSAFAAPPQVRGTFPGNAPLDTVVGPGRNNIDMTFTKTFPIREKKQLTFRWEIYTIFNHPSFYQMNVAARFDPATGQQVNAGFGQLTNTLTPRQMQLSLRYAF